jgi:hypothetical protein
LFILSLLLPLEHTHNLSPLNESSRLEDAIRGLELNKGTTLFFFPLVGFPSPCGAAKQGISFGDTLIRAGTLSHQVKAVKILHEGLFSRAIERGAAPVLVSHPLARRSVHLRVSRKGEIPLIVQPRGLELFLGPSSRSRRRQSITRNHSVRGKEITKVPWEPHG